MKDDSARERMKFTGPDAGSPPVSRETGYVEKVWGDIASGSGAADV
jgi:hypothetical protein